MDECPDSVVRAPSECLLDDGVVWWRRERWKILDWRSEEECPLATSLRGTSVGPAYLARPTRSEESRPCGLSVRDELCLLATSLWGASVGPAYLARPTRSGEERTNSPRRRGGGVSVGVEPRCRLLACLTSYMAICLCVKKNHRGIHLIQY